MAAQVINLTDTSLRAYLQEKKTPLLLAFWAPWSSPCAAHEAMLKEIAHDYQKRLTVSRLNIDENAHAPAEYGVKTIPYFLLIDQGVVVATLAGPQPKAKILETIDRQLAN